VSASDGNEQAVEVSFVASNKTACWTKDSGTLLDLARAHGLDPLVGCEEGWCGSCVTPVLAGAVSYETEPACRVEEGHCLICRAVPDARRGPLRLEL